MNYLLNYEPQKEKQIWGGYGLRRKRIKFYLGSLDTSRDMDLKFSKADEPINAESKVTRAWRVFVAETGQVITLSLFFVFWAPLRAQLQPPLQLRGHLRGFVLAHDAISGPGLFRLPVLHHRGWQSFFCKGPDGNFIRPCELHSLLYNNSTLPL